MEYNKFNKNILDYIFGNFFLFLNNKFIKRIFIYTTYLYYIFTVIYLTDLFDFPYYAFTVIRDFLLYYVAFFALLRFNSYTKLTGVPVSHYDRHVIFTAGHYLLFTTTYFKKIEEKIEEKLKKKITVITEVGGNFVNSLPFQFG